MCLLNIGNGHNYDGGRYQGGDDGGLAATMEAGKVGIMKAVRKGIVAILILDLFTSLLIFHL